MGESLFQSFVQGGEPITLLLFTLLKQPLTLRKADYTHIPMLGTTELSSLSCSSE